MSNLRISSGCYEIWVIKDTKISWKLKIIVNTSMSINRKASDNNWVKAPENSTNSLTYNIREKLKHKGIIEKGQCLINKHPRKNEQK